MSLPIDAEARKQVPIYSGVIRYFPRALAAVAECSRVGNDQHNPGKPLHWDRAKSGDELDALTRHLVDAGTVDSDGILHSTKVAWRALANLEKELEQEEERHRGGAGELLDLEGTWEDDAHTRAFRKVFVEHSFPMTDDEKPPYPTHFAGVGAPHREGGKPFEIKADLTTPAGWRLLIDALTEDQRSAFCELMLESVTA